MLDSRAQRIRCMERVDAFVHACRVAMKLNPIMNPFSDRRMVLLSLVSGTLVSSGSRDQGRESVDAVNEVRS